MSESEAEVVSVPTVEYGTTAGTGEQRATLHDVVLVVLRLIGVYAIIQAVPYLSYVPFVFTFDANAVMTLLPAACWVGLGIFLITNAGWVAGRLVQVPQRAGVPSTPAGEQFQAVAFSVAGVMLAVWGLAGLAGKVAGLVAAEGARSAGQVVPSETLEWLAEPAVETALGVFLFLRARGLAALWHRLQMAGLHRDNAG